MRRRFAEIVQRRIFVKNRNVLFIHIQRNYVNVPRLNTLKDMDMYAIRKNVELCKKKNVKIKDVWNNFLYILILKLCNNEMHNYVDFMIILKLLSKYISLDKRVMVFICEKLEQDMYKLSIRELNLLLLILRKNNFDSSYFINLICKSILMKINKNVSYKDLALISFSLSSNTTILDEKVFTNEIFNFTILKIYNDLKNINYHTLSLFFYSFSLYFINNFDYFNSFFYMIKNFIKNIKRNMDSFNSTDLMFTFISSMHIYNSFRTNSTSVTSVSKSSSLYVEKNAHITPPSLNGYLNNIPAHASCRRVTREGGDTLNKGKSKVQLTKLEKRFDSNNGAEEGKLSTISNLVKEDSGKYRRAAHRGMYSSIKEESTENFNLPIEPIDSVEKQCQNDLKKKEFILEDLIDSIKIVIAEKLKCFKVEEAVNILFASLCRNFTFNKKYFNIFNKHRINVQDYINVCIKTEYKKCMEEEQEDEKEEEKLDYILKINTTNNNLHNDETFINIVMEEIIYRNDCLSIKQIILLLYLLSNSNVMYLQFEKIILKRLACMEKELNKKEIMFIYQFLYLRTCLFPELKKYSLKIYEQDSNKTVVICNINKDTKKSSVRISNEYAKETTIFNDKKNYENNNVYYMHDDVLYLKKKRKRDKNKIFLYDNFIFKYPAQVRINEKSDNFENVRNLNCFIDIKRRREEMDDHVFSKNRKLINEEKCNEFKISADKKCNSIQTQSSSISCTHNSKSTSVASNITKTIPCSNIGESPNIFAFGKKVFPSYNVIDEYRINCYNLQLDVYKIVCLKLLDWLRNEKLASCTTIIDILCIYEKLNVRDYRIIRYMYTLKKKILYLDNKYIIKIMNIILKFNLYSILQYLNIDKFLKFMTFNSLDESIEILNLVGMLSVIYGKNSYHNFPAFNIENIIIYILKNFKKLIITKQLKRANITNVYNSLPLKLYKLFKNVQCMEDDAVKRTCARYDAIGAYNYDGYQIASFEEKSDLVWSGKNMKNFCIYNVDDVNLKEVKIKPSTYTMGSVRNNIEVNSYIYEYRDVEDELYEDLLLMFGKNVEIYKDINISNYAFPMAINLLTLNHHQGEGNNHSLIRMNMCSNGWSNECIIERSNQCNREWSRGHNSKHGHDKTLELNKKNFLLVDILYSHDFYYSLNEAKQNKLKKRHVYVCYFGSHVNKMNKRIINYKKYTILRLIKKRGYNYICIDAKTYVKNKKNKKSDNSLNKIYISNLILDLLERKKRTNVLYRKGGRSKSSIVEAHTNKLLVYHLKNKTSAFAAIKNYRLKSANTSLFIRRNKNESKTYAQGKTLYTDGDTEKKRAKEKPPSNHLTKLKHMFQSV
ncbi:conserved Plasmodium protein, unknown function [Plasmodium malariae]|uniref:Uncharacterized protein n=1 Tax=Plasmodium malariae TaxID=5858 RepID=A0A1D3PB69_PLAMA|nr:conserved Plasmodium protein, unknown function [Plasmodium malariae]SCN12294.1 conserved Plasmodium protein, unknown function [Plasmodium malariae]